MIIVVKWGKDCETISVQVLVRGCRCARITRPFAGDDWGGQRLATSSSQPDHRCPLHVWLINFNWQQLKILSQQLHVLRISVFILIICELLFFFIREDISQGWIIRKWLKLEKKLYIFLSIHVYYRDKKTGLTWK